MLVLLSGKRIEFFQVCDYIFQVLGSDTYSPIFIIERPVMIEWASYNIRELSNLFLNDFELHLYCCFILGDICILLSYDLS